ncbi:SET domain-containing protein [Obba rivulosa]|uniref:SET domain-containing protein n=1 Tax=Obba rivulosa TaxID=1052685 RepID=A0A8E2AS72_9APHY|nr:SET domain-containing protein [Obba rivulosa]
MNDPEGITECILYVGLKEAIFSQLGFPRPLPRPTSPAHCIKSAPGAGLGIFATRDIKFTELVCAERPLLLAPGAYMARAVPDAGSMPERQQLAWQEYENLINCAVQRMLPKNRETFMSLLNSHSKLGTPPFVGRMRTNGFNAGKDLKVIAPAMPDGDMGRYTAVGSIMSRLNHSCSPNGHVDFDPGSLSLQLTAMRDIAVGEQITISYCDVFLSQAERQKGLKRFDFICTCRACKDYKHSDKRRRQISASKAVLEQSIFDWIEDPTLPDDYLEKKYLRLLDLMDQEGLQASGTYATCKEMLAKVYAALGDPERSVQYATEFISSQVPRKGGRWLPPETCNMAVDVTARTWLDQFWQKRIQSCNGSGSGSGNGRSSGSGSGSASASGSSSGRAGSSGGR